MIQYAKVFTILIFFQLTAKYILGQSIDSLYFEKAKVFANHLYATNNFKDAAIEFERIFVIDQAEQTAIKLLRSYRKAGNYEVGFKRFNDIFPDKQVLAKEVILEFTRYLMEMGFLNDAENFITNQAEIDKNEKYAIASICAAKRLDFEKFETYLEYIDENATKDILTKIYHIHLSKKKKSPTIAALMSTAVPGLGKVYTGNWKDGLISFTFVGTTTWQSIVGFRTNGTSSIYGWIFGSLATGFYLGNIYGSAKDADKENQANNNKFLNDIDKFYKANFS